MLTDPPKHLGQDPGQSNQSQATEAPVSLEGTGTSSPGDPEAKPWLIYRKRRSRKKSAPGLSSSLGAREGSQPTVHTTLVADGAHGDSEDVTSSHKIKRPNKDWEEAISNFCIRALLQRLVNLFWPVAAVTTVLRTQAAPAARSQARVSSLRGLIAMGQSVSVNSRDPVTLLRVLHQNSSCAGKLRPG